MLTKKDLLEAIEDMPMDMPVKICRGSLYVGIDNIYLNKLWEKLFALMYGED